MSSKAMSFKAHINNYAKKNGIAAQVVLQNYMFERFLERLSCSEYSSKFVIKGGMLVAAIVGLDIRSTMDLDATLRNLPLSEDQILKAIKEICNVAVDDGVTFEIKSVEPIRKDDKYGGYCVRLDAIYEAIITPLSIDISTGDVITPDAVRYEFVGLFDDEVKFKLWGYNVETVLAEKVETILRRGIFNTRPRDFYDVYILSTTKSYDKKVFREALTATAKHRGSSNQIIDTQGILKQIGESSDLRAMWDKYRKKFPYAKNIEYDAVIAAVANLLRI